MIYGGMPSAHQFKYDSAFFRIPNLDIKEDSASCDCHLTISLSCGSLGAEGGSPQNLGLPDFSDSIASM